MPPRPHRAAAPMMLRARRSTVLGCRRTAAIQRRRSDRRGESLAFVVLWPGLIVLILLLLVHAFIVSSARAEASVAASEGLRAAWRSTTGLDPDLDGGGALAATAHAAVAEAAASTQGWRWWRPDIATVWSTYCGGDAAPTDAVESGWVRVQIEGTVNGPLSALWPGRLDTVYAVAEGPAVLAAAGPGQDDSDEAWTPPQECTDAQDATPCLHVCPS